MIFDAGVSNIAIYLVGRLGNRYRITDNIRKLYNVRSVSQNIERQISVSKYLTSIQLSYLVCRGMTALRAGHIFPTKEGGVPTLFPQYMSLRFLTESLCQGTR